MKTILIVDDEEVLRRLILITLGNRDYRLLEAADGIKAFEMARSRRPDLILIDWNIPGMSGVEVVKELRKETSTSNIPVILLTGTDVAELENQALPLVGCDYLLKPFSITQLLEKIEKALS